MNGQGVAFVNIIPDPASAALAATGVARSADAFAMENNIAAAALSSQRMAASVGYGIWQPRAIDAKMYSAAGFYRPTDRLAVALLGIRRAIVAAIDRAVIGVGFQLLAAIAADQLVVAMSAPQNPRQ